MRLQALASMLMVGIALPAVSAAQEAGADPTWATPAERSEYLAFTAVEDVVPYLERLSTAFPALTLDTLAILGSGSREPVTLPVARIGPGEADAADTPIRVLVIGSQHGTERAGLEASLRILRDLVAGDLAELRPRLEVRVVPMANPRGVMRRTRGATGGVDLNRDHVLFSAPETRALWSEVAAWRPHLVLDLHELGPTEYSVQIGVPTHPNTEPGLATFARYLMLPQVANQLARADIWYHEYVATWAGDTEGDVFYTPAPLDAANARNAFGLLGAASFLVETASSRDIIGLAERTEHMYVAARAFLEAAVLLADDLLRISAVAAALPDGPLTLGAHYVSNPAGTGLPWVEVNERGFRVRSRLSPWYPQIETVGELAMPRGWMLGAEAADLAETIRAHGFAVEPMKSSRTLRVETYHGCAPAAGVGAGLAPERREFGPGSWWVAADQPGARLLFTIIEPWSGDGWFAPADDADCAEQEYPVFRVPA